MQLTKSCSKEFNIRNGTLKLGTLHEYRKTEIKNLEDKEEGIFIFNLFFDGIVNANARWINTLFGRAMQFGPTPGVRFPGKFDVAVHEINVVTIGTETITLRNSSATIQRETPNRFIFCMHQLQNAEDCLGIFPNYDDYWNIPQKNAEQFGIQISNVLREKIKRQHKSGIYIIPKNVEPDSMIIYMQHGAITYTPRTLHITNDSEQDFERLMENMNDMAFVKPPIPFKRESEYRFIFTLLTKNMQIIEPKIEPITDGLILDASSLLHFLNQP